MKSQIDPARVPEHVAVIMDGNGRWAAQQGQLRVFGHQSGVKAVRDTVEGAAEIGIRYLTMYAFSTENWNRPRTEVDALMELLVSTINAETKTLNENNIRLKAVGDIDSLPAKCRSELAEAIKKTESNTRMTLVLALSYSSRWEIVRAVKNIAEDVRKGILDPGTISESMVNSYLCTADIPDPALLIRTSGELRISNFLLWQIAYAELYFTDKLWPDFRKEDLFRALIDFQGRERRFGLTSEQITGV